MKKTLGEIANYLDVECRGDASALITGIAPLQAAKEGDICFLNNSLYEKYLTETKASAVILKPELAEQCSASVLITDDPYFAYARCAQLFDNTPKVAGKIDSTAIIDSTSQVHASASIGPHCVIAAGVVIEENVILGPGCVIGEGSRIGKNSRFWANVTLYHGVNIGERALVHSGVVIGSDGFGHAKHNGAWHKVPQLGGVVIGNDVEIGANTTIDRGALEDTVIGDGVKLDNQIQIGHNVQIGEHTLIAGCTGVAGSTKIGKHCLIGGGVCIVGHLDIVDNVIVTGMTGVSRSLTKPGLYSSGTNVQDNRDWRKNVARFNQLDKLARRLLRLERTVQVQD